MTKLTADKVERGKDIFLIPGFSNGCRLEIEIGTAYSTQYGFSRATTFRDNAGQFLNPKLDADDFARLGMVFIKIANELKALNEKRITDNA